GARSRNPQISLHAPKRAMAHLAPILSLITAVLLSCQAVATASAHYERAYPPRILAASAAAPVFYMECRAREEAGGYGHSYVTLGEIDASGGTRQTIVAGFPPAGPESGRWGQRGVTVA